MIIHHGLALMQPESAMTDMLDIRIKTASNSARRWMGTVYRFWLAFALLSAGLPLSALGIEMTAAEHLMTIEHRFKAPSDVAVSPDNRIFVMDGVNHKIKVFDSGGAFLSEFGRQGAGPGEFRQPLGVDIDGSGRVYVADTGNHRVQVLTPEGNFIAEIRLKGTSAHPADPTDLAIDEDRNRGYIVDNDNHRILVYDLATLQLRAEYGRQGSAREEFRYPFKIDLNKNGDLHIVDVINTRVQVLAADGSWVAMIGDWGVERGEFFRPKGVAIDRRGRLYVSDSYIGVIQVFEPNGRFHSVVGDRSTGAIRKFNTPTGLFIDHRNRLYVVEMLAHRVSVYRIP
jgi:tripartite motif-containing protein 71